MGPTAPWGTPQAEVLLVQLGPATSEPHPQQAPGQGVASGPREAAYPGMLRLLGWEAFCITQGKASKCKYQTCFLGSFCRWLHKADCHLQSVTF